MLLRIEDWFAHKSRITLIVIAFIFSMFRI